MVEKHFSLLKDYETVRAVSLKIIEPLEIEEMVVQPTTEVSPIKWHLGHTTWFYEKFILEKLGYELSNNASYNLIFNSYYKSAGKHWEQGKRGALSRPTVDQIIQYRKSIDKKIQNLSLDELKKIDSLLIAGLHHEMQHQELMYMDLKYVKYNEVIKTPYIEATLTTQQSAVEGWQTIQEGLYIIGNTSKHFHYDNETAPHKVHINECAISKNYVTNGEFLEFILSDGYKRAELWLSMGWDWINNNNIYAPLYWHKKDNEWHEYTLHGEVKLNLQSPVAHISYFEADAYARWKKLRLPTEFELEVFDRITSSSHSRVSRDNTLHPQAIRGQNNELWCWTSSQYSPYPGFKPFLDSLSEYNGKFMCNQFVLRGGCFTTPKGHYRSTYRNFYLPQQRWMFSGIRLTKDLHEF